MLTIEIIMQVKKAKWCLKKNEAKEEDEEFKEQKSMVCITCFYNMLHSMKKRGKQMHWIQLYFQITWEFTWSTLHSVPCYALIPLEFCDARRWRWRERHS